MSTVRSGYAVLKHQHKEEPVTAGSSADDAAWGNLPRWPKRPQRLATAVVSDLADRIVAGEVAVGAPLPVEPVLCERYAVSRTTVREAVKALEAMRLVEVRQGSGTSVRARSDWNLLDPVVLAAVVAHDDDLDILDEIIALRCELEGAMARRAAGRLDDDPRATLGGLLAQLDGATDDPDLYLDLDVAFHDIIMSASASPLSHAIITNLNTQVFGSGAYIGTPTSADRKKSNAGHHEILTALAAADGDAAGQAMSQHISSSWLRRRPATPGGSRRELLSPGRRPPCPRSAPAWQKPPA
ncbi:MAG TPA: FCD domain-containing protein [Trebonia sp.]|jgi:DNA-binding FadR family transcriptional regulator|nr:FCD domain-containing protein [Trebonia sp.]